MQDEDKDLHKNQEQVYTYPLPEFERMSFWGGGAPCIVYLAAVFDLIERGVFPEETKSIAGTSAGGIVGVPLGLGFVEEELKRIVQNTDFTAFKDMEAKSFWYKLGLYSIETVTSVLRNNPGVYKGDVISNWAKWIVYVGLGNPNATFRDLSKARAVNPGLKELYLVAYNITTPKFQQFSIEDTPDVCIWEALRATMSIPFVFKPFLVKINKEVSLFVDGGLVQNNPQSIFDDKKFQNQDYGLNDNNANPCCVGFMVEGKSLVDNDELINNDEKISSNELTNELIKASDDIFINYKGNEQVTLFEKLRSIIKANNVKDETELYKKYKDLTVSLDAMGHSSLDFDFPPKKLDELLSVNRKISKDYFNRYYARKDYGKERQDNIKRLEMIRNIKEKPLLDLYTNLIVQLILLIDKIKLQFVEVESLSSNIFSQPINNYIDIKNNTLDEGITTESYSHQSEEINKSKGYNISQNTPLKNIAKVLEVLNGFIENIDCLTCIYDTCDNCNSKEYLEKIEHTNNLKIVVEDSINVSNQDISYIDGYFFNSNKDNLSTNKDTKYNKNFIYTFDFNDNDKKNVYLKERLIYLVSLSQKILSLKHRLEDIINYTFKDGGRFKPPANDFIQRIVAKEREKIIIREKQLKQAKTERLSRINLLDLEKNTYFASKELVDIFKKTNNDDLFNSKLETLKLHIKLRPFSIYKACLLGIESNSKLNLLIIAAITGNVEVISMLLELEREMCVRNMVLEEYKLIKLEDKNNPCKMEKIISESIKSLNNKNIFTVKGKNGSTVAHNAAIYGYLDIVKLFAASRLVDFNTSGPNNSSTLLACARLSKTNVVQYLLQSNYDNKLYYPLALDSVDNNKLSLLHYIVKNNTAELINSFFAIINSYRTGGYKKYTDIKDGDNKSPLHYIAESNLLKIYNEIKKLCVGWRWSGYWAVKDIFDLNARNKDNKTPYMEAKDRGHVKLAEELSKDQFKSNLSVDNNKNKVLIRHNSI